MDFSGLPVRGPVASSYTRLPAGGGTAGCSSQRGATTSTPGRSSSSVGRGGRGSSWYAGDRRVAAGRGRPQAARRAGLEVRRNLLCHRGHRLVADLTGIRGNEAGARGSGLAAERHSDVAMAQVTAHRRPREELDSLRRSEVGEG
jgi:hypothetical protein